MITKIIKIGNSKGIRIPKPVFEELGMPDEVELVLQNREIILRPVKHPRRGWEEQFRVATSMEKGNDLNDEDLIENEWDTKEWTW